MSEATATEPEPTTEPAPTTEPESTTEPAPTTEPEPAGEYVPLPPGPPPPPISMDDLLNSVQVLQQKEADDKNLLESIGNISQEGLKTKLITWAIAGFPNAYEIHSIAVVPPPQCSDGIYRNLPDYIAFCSGKTIQEHIDSLQQKVANISISFANMGSHISIVVSKT